MIRDHHGTLLRIFSQLVREELAFKVESLALLERLSHVHALTLTIY